MATSKKAEKPAAKSSAKPKAAPRPRAAASSADEPKAAPKSKAAPAPDHLDQFKKHASAGALEASKALEHGVGYLSEQLDSAGILAKRGARDAKKKASEWAKENPALAAVAASAAATVALSAVSKLFRRK